MTPDSLGLWLGRCLYRRRRLAFCSAGQALCPVAAGHWLVAGNGFADGSDEQVEHSEVLGPETAEFAAVAVEERPAVGAAPAVGAVPARQGNPQ